MNMEQSTSVLPPNIQRVLPRTVPGPVNINNVGSVDWGWQGFVAYGAQHSVVVVDPVTLQCIQTLNKHSGHVTNVRWRKTRHYHQLSVPYSLALASSDQLGTIILWDVQNSEAVAAMSDGNKPILDLEWLGGIDGSEHLLAALHPPNSLIIWDTRHSSKVWKKSYSEPLISFHFDPFCVNRMAFLCQGSVLFIDDFSLSRCPSSNGTKLYISSPRSSPLKAGSAEISLGHCSPTKTTSSRIRQKMKELVGVEFKSKNEDSMTECLQLLFHQMNKDLLLIIYSWEVLMVDLGINQTVGYISLETCLSPCSQILLCRQHDALFCLHESGAVSIHLRKHVDPLVDEETWTSENDKNSCEIMYDRKWQSEPLLLNKNNHVIGMAVNPVSEKHIGLVLDDGRMVFEEVVSVNICDESKETSLVDNLAEASFEPVKKEEGHKAINLCSLQISLKDLVVSCNASTNQSMRMQMTGIIPSLSPPPLVMRMCPPLTTRNVGQYVPLLAAGTHTGIVHIINLSTGVSQGEFAVHMFPVRGIEWTSLSTILTFANQPVINKPGFFCNELVHTDIASCKSTILRQNKSADESSIEMIRVSYMKQYFIVVFRDDPFELWDAASLTQLRVMSRRSPRVTALEWSPSSSKPRVRRRSSLAEIILAGRAFSGEGSGAMDKETDLRVGEVSEENGEENETGKCCEVDEENAEDPVVETDKEKREVDVPAEGKIVLPISGKIIFSKEESCRSRDANRRQSLDAVAAKEQVDASMMQSINSTMETSNVRSWVRELFVFTDANGHMYQFWAEGTLVKEVSKGPADPQINEVTYLSWKSQEIVLCDTDGNLNIWDLKSRFSRHVATHRGRIRKARFAPGKDNMKLLTLFADGVDVWDVREMVLISQLKTSRDAAKIVDIDWAASDRPVLVSSDGFLRVTDLSLKYSSSPVDQYKMEAIVSSVSLLGGEASLNVRSLLMHQPWRGQYSLSFSAEDGFIEQQLHLTTTWLQRLPQQIKDFLMSCNSIAHRCLVTSQLLGDEGDFEFWNVALHYLNIFSKKKISSAAVDANDKLGGETNKKDDPINVKNVMSGTPEAAMESCFHYLCDSNTFRDIELRRLSLQEGKDGKRLQGLQRANLCRSLALMGERDRAIKLLLDTDATDPSFYVDCLRASLLSVSGHSTETQSTIKLVATNLIAAGNVWEGVELLCLINKGSDACGYLQSLGKWEDSAWLAKVALPPEEAKEILRRWSQHLISSGQKDVGVCTLLSIGNFTAALEQLVHQHYHERAALLMMAAAQMEVFTDGEQQSALFENIQRKYALYLFSLGNQDAFSYYKKLLKKEEEELVDEASVVLM